ncbi:hypothetical protein [Streptomyces sp. NBC_01233]|uniref:hypothetical protein n=1 Tax=Streptomyces sp. NBC_01233 TaxID=2903787 RepID=UPI002E0F7724|nr:hypothetical protein OG332_30085 [Streptomyces sp. NBC_01233]
MTMRTKGVAATGYEARGGADQAGQDVGQRSAANPTYKLGYSWGTADSDPLNSTLRAITPRRVPVTISRLHLLDVTFTQQPLDGCRSAWDISWTPIAVLPLGCGV